MVKWRPRTTSLPRGGPHLVPGDQGGDVALLLKILLEVIVGGKTERQFMVRLAPAAVTPMQLLSSNYLTP